MCGTGKTTILEALGFIGAVASGSVSAWLSAQGCRPVGVLSSGSRRSTVSLETDIRLPHGYARWSAKINIRTLRCSSERIIFAADDSFSDPRTCLDMSGQRLTAGGRTYALKHIYEGSALGSFQAQEVEQFFDPVCREVRRVLSSIRSSGQLNLRELRETSVAKKCAARNWRLSDGMLRMIGISELVNSEGSLICVDEVENGFCMELYETLAELLVDSTRQIVVTANSPQFLNCLPEESAPRCTQLVYLDMNCVTRACPLVSLKELEEPLTMYLTGDAVRRVGLAVLGSEAAKSSASLPAAD